MDAATCGRASAQRAAGLKDSHQVAVGQESTTASFNASAEASSSSFSTDFSKEQHVSNREPTLSVVYGEKMRMMHHCSSKRAFSEQKRSTEEQKDSKPPPMNVIVFQDSPGLFRASGRNKRGMASSPPMGRPSSDSSEPFPSVPAEKHSAHHQLSSFRAGRADGYSMNTAHSAQPAMPSSLFPGMSPSSLSPFRLQPRQPVSVRPSLSLEHARGRKRAAQSMASSASSSTQQSESQDDGDSLLASPQTPSQYPFTSPLGLASPGQGSPGLQLQGLSLHSPGSQNSFVLRSSFSKYNGGAGPGGGASISTATATRASSTSPGGASYAAASIRSACSPRFAPLKVLRSDPHHPRPPLPNASFQLHSLDSSATTPSRAKTNRNGTAPDSPPDRLPEALPLRTVVCHPLPSQLRQQNDDVRNSAITPPRLSLRPSTNSSVNSCGGQRNSQSHLESSPMPSVASSHFSPTSTPLPKLSLTPRSTGSRGSRRSNELPAFPSPADLDVTMTFTSVATQPSGQPVDRSFIPFPDWASFPSQRSSARTDTRETLFPIQRPTSLLAPPAPDDALERFLGVTAMESEQGDIDNDSLSASDDDDDDDEAFLLAAPSVIEQEKQDAVAAMNGNSNKQRKLSRSTMPSNTSLRGMDFVTSSASLLAMDRESSNMLSQQYEESAVEANKKVVGAGKVKCDPPLSPGSLGPATATGWGLRKDAIHRQESQTSIGLNLDPTCSNASLDPEEEDDDRKPSPGPDAKTSERNLCTPPPMSRAHSPPPLSFNGDGTFDGAGETYGPNASGGRRPPGNKAGIHYHTALSPPAPWFCTGEVLENENDMITTHRFVQVTTATSPGTAGADNYMSSGLLFN